MDTEIEEVKQEIRKVQQQIDDVEEKLTKKISEDEVAYWRKEKERLGKEKMLLLEDKKLLREALLEDKKLLREALLEDKREEKRLRLKADTSDNDFVDRSGEGITQMLLPQDTLTQLPQHEHDLANVLFPEQPGKLPVLMQAYIEMRRRNHHVAETFLNSTDYSNLAVFVSHFLNSPLGRVLSEITVSALLVQTFTTAFYFWGTYSSCKFRNTWLFNCNEKTGDSHSATTRKRCRPDSLLTANGCTFLVGEDKCCSMTAAKSDLEEKMLPLSAMFYGEVQFILGYIASGNEFQWVYINKYGKIRGAGRRLDLSTDIDRCMFLLSIGYAYQLLSKMVVTVPEVLGRRAMFTEDVVGDRVIRFYYNSVRKSIKKFPKFCESRGTGLDVILKAYEAGEKKGCSSLPRLIGTKPGIGRTGTYTVEISPLGYFPTLSSEHDIRMLAKNVCEALSVLHEAGLVHRDVRYPNVVQVSKEQFVLIDLETVAVAPFRVRQEFEWFIEWSNEMLEDGFYTPMSDMYQLGRLLKGRISRVSTPLPLLFLEKLSLKQYTAAMALRDPWLSDPIV